MKRTKKTAADTDDRTPWQLQQDAMFEEVSRKHGGEARRIFRSFKATTLADVARERLNKRKALDKMRRKFESLQAEYLRIPATTYDGWLKFGPKDEWDEVVHAAWDDAVWDRLVERGVVE